jgi:hypothetical protein
VIGLLGGAEAWSTEALFIPKLGLTARLARHRIGSTWAAGLWTTASYRLDFETRPNPLGVRIKGGLLDLLFTAEHQSGPGRWLAGVGGGCDVRVVEPVSSPSLIDSARSRAVLFAASGAVAYESSLSRHFRFLAALSFNLFPRQQRYVAFAESVPARIVFNPWMVRAGLVIGVEWGRRPAPPSTP